MEMMCQSETTSSGCRSHQQPRKRVRFCATDPIEKVLPPRDHRNEDVWYQPEDYENFRFQKQQLVKMVKSDERLLDCITRAYEVACLVASKVLDEGQLSQVLSVVRLDHRIAVLWCGGLSFRGLERQLGLYSALQPFDENQEQQQQGLHDSNGGNQTLQNSCHKKKKSISTMMEMSDDDLRQAHEKKSRLDRIFARLMGAADASVVALQDDHNKKDLLIQASSQRLPKGVRRRQYHSSQA